TRQDRRRTASLEDHGLHVLRYRNSEVLKQTGAAVAAVARRLISIPRTRYDRPHRSSAVSAGLARGNIYDQA
ncbi:MAG: DUF559 domain-containing protein, partial [Candidatus Binataceae bacterium]